jgi:CBS domain-containing protein
MFVRQCMEKTMVTCQPNASLQEVCRKLKEYEVGSVLIVDEGWKLKGIVTDRDVALAIGTDSKNPANTFACDIMTADPLTIDFEADLDSAIRVMNRSHVRRLPVTEHGKLIGILSSSDVARAIHGEFDDFLGIEESYIKH